MSQVSFGQRSESGEGTTKKIIGIAIAIIVTAVVFPLALQTLADSSLSNTTFLGENEVFQLEPSTGDVMVGVYVFNENFPENALIYEVEINPVENVDNFEYSRGMAYSEGGSETAVFLHNHIFVDNNESVDYENEISMSEISDTADNIRTNSSIENLHADGKEIGLSKDNIATHFETFQVRLIGLESGSSSPVQTLLFVLLPILAVIAVIRLIFDNS